MLYSFNSLSSSPHFFHLPSPSTNNSVMRIKKSWLINVKSAKSSDASLCRSQWYKHKPSQLHHSLFEVISLSPVFWVKSDDLFDPSVSLKGYKNYMFTRPPYVTKTTLWTVLPTRTPESVLITVIIAVIWISPCRCWIDAVRSSKQSQRLLFQIRVIILTRAVSGLMSSEQLICEHSYLTGRGQSPTDDWAMIADIEERNHMLWLDLPWTVLCILEACDIIMCWYQ